MPYIPHLPSTMNRRVFTDRRRSGWCCGRVASSSCSGDEEQAELFEQAECSARALRCHAVGDDGRDAGRIGLEGRRGLPGIVHGTLLSDRMMIENLNQAAKGFTRRRRPPAAAIRGHPPRICGNWPARRVRRRTEEGAVERITRPGERAGRRASRPGRGRAGRRGWRLESEPPALGPLAGRVRPGERVRELLRCSATAGRGRRPTSGSRGATNPIEVAPAPPGCGTAGPAGTRRIPRHPPPPTRSPRAPRIPASTPRRESRRIPHWSRRKDPGHSGPARRAQQSPRPGRPPVEPGEETGREAEDQDEDPQATPSLSVTEPGKHECLAEEVGFTHHYFRFRHASRITFQIINDFKNSSRSTADGTHFVRAAVRRGRRRGPRELSPPPPVCPAFPTSDRAG